MLQIRLGDFGTRNPIFESKSRRLVGFRKAFSTSHRDFLNFFFRTKEMYHKKNYNLEILIIFHD